MEKHPIPMVLLVNMHLIKRVRLFSHVVWLGKGQFQWSIGTNGTIGTNRKCHSNGSIGEYASIEGVKMLLPIEIDESFLKVVLNWQILTAVPFMVFIVRNRVF